jgi:arylsulfatase A-like enzyme
MVGEVDAMVGEIVEALETTGLADSTWVINTSDHGEMNLEHGQYLKNSLYESSVRVPLIINGPGAQAGRRIEQPVSLVDIFPTLMDMADAPKPDWLEGESLMPGLLGGPSRHPDWVISEYHSNFQNTGSFMLRTGRWKYIVYPGYESQLFDLEEDPDETHNLAPIMPDLVGSLDEKLREIVDYEEVDARAKAYDRRNFTEWRQAASEEEYNQRMRHAIRGYGEEHEAKVQAWLASS